MNVNNKLYLFEGSVHLFLLECAGYEGPITFYLKYVYNPFAEVKFFLSLNEHLEPNARNCHKKVEGKQKSFQIKHP